MYLLERTLLNRARTVVFHIAADNGRHHTKTGVLEGIQPVSAQVVRSVIHNEHAQSPSLK